MTAAPGQAAAPEQAAPKQVPGRPARSRAAAPDAACAAAVDLARAAVASHAASDDLAPAPGSADPSVVGEHLRFTVDGDRVGTHWFACRAAGYPDWEWAVTVVRASRAREVTVDEVALLPVAGALLPPAWVPWARRVAPGDLGPGDLLPTAPDDPRLEPGYTGAEVGGGGAAGGAAGDDVAAVAAELGLGRERVLSPIGRDDAADRWVADGAGGDDPVAQAAPGQCSTCGFLVALGGPLAQAFGICANAWAPRDGRVVAYDFGCGAHSSVAPVHVPGQTAETRVSGDDHDLEPLDAVAG